MKKNVLFLAFLGLFACKEAPKETKSESQPQELSMKKMEKKFPAELQKVFNAHGSLETWRSYRTLAYEMPKDENSETHTVDLYNRKDRIDTPAYSMGFDGKQVWSLDPDEVYGGDPVFYHNLMFYFYAMPFVLADDGIVYGETEDLVFEGKNYPGIAISYETGIGTSPKDEYYIHYDPDTNQMAWLGYTVTYRTGEKSENVKWIRYNNWNTVGEVSLPASITWYNYEGREIKDARSPVPFENASLEKNARPDAFYAMPEGARVRERGTK
ncbi:DUF6503 family protein [Poritiphilus flavus]|uniref:Threonine synthase n=1 Tax=Poritiphilus flavus TaxID=2697053 RepID=A0A6L9EA93_9FLAO|nr:DUF6503 family protein [Poritiphilus flavus]NAS11379.1 hypothetical protein [Poritiphilus flavus]